MSLFERLTHSGWTKEEWDLITDRAMVVPYVRRASKIYGLDLAEDPNVKDHTYLQLKLNEAEAMGLDLYHMRMWFSYGLRARDSAHAS